MPRYLTYQKLCEYYEKHGCTVDIPESEFTPNVTKNKVPYRCPLGHIVTNLTKNNFNARVNQGLNPCAQCSIKGTKQRREDTISSALEKAGCELLVLNDDRSLSYVCSCGVECQSYDSNVLKDHFIGCSTCANPFNRSEIQEQIKQTNLEKYGCENPFQAEEIKEKIKETNLEKYGCENVMQNAKIFSKQKRSCYSKRKYTLPSGRDIWIMGHEDLCIDHLLEEYDEDEMMYEDHEKPEIRYSNSEKDGRMSRYYPDLYIPNKNIVIEVKSPYTLQSEYKQNMEKFRATVDDGYELYLYVFNRRCTPQLLYTKIYTKDRTVVCPYPPANIVIVDDSDDEE